MSLEGTNEIKVNGSTITLGMLKQITATLVDVYGQFEHSALLDTNKHIELLDEYAKNMLANPLSNYTIELNELKQLEKQKVLLGGDESQRKQRLDYLNFVINELESANLIKGEYSELEQEHLMLSNIEKIKSTYQSVINILNLDDGVNSKLYNSIKNLNQITEYVPNICELTERLESVNIEIEDICSNINDLNNKIDYSADRFLAVEERLSKLDFLRKKYSLSIEELIDYLLQLQEERNLLESSEEKIQEIDKKIINQTAKVNNIAESITTIRKDNAQILEKKIIDNLKDLGMRNSQVVFQIEKSQDFLDNGMDIVELLFSANIGEPPKPLSKIISGGEMSRLSLAQKCVMHENINGFTMVFDEIDAGVSGQMGQEIAKKLAKISLQNQIICISHLPQIASMADTHYKISKKTNEDKTISSIEIMDENGSICEIARLSGGENISQYAIQHANEIKKWAIEQKNIIKKE